MSSHPSVRLGRNVYIDPTAYVSGDVTLGDDCTVMPQAVIRGDVAPIEIGSRVNIQDGAILHCNVGDGLTIGDDVGIGHGAVVHCSRVDSHTLIGIRSVLLDKCTVGRDCIIAAGTILPPGTDIPDQTVVMGHPGRVVRSTTDRDLAYISHVVESYLSLGRQHAAGRYPAFPPPQVP